MKESHSTKKIARKSFWLRQGLEHVTAGFTVNQVKTVLTSTRERVKSVKSGTYTMKSVVRPKKTSHCNNRALLTRKAPNKKHLRLLGIGKKFRLLMQSCRFFSPNILMKISNFSKTVHTIFIKFCTVILHLKGVLCAHKHRNRMTGIRAKISPKMAKKTVIFRLFLIFSKTVHTIRTKFSTVILHHSGVLYVQWHQNCTAGM